MASRRRAEESAGHSDREIRILLELQDEAERRAVEFVGFSEPLSFKSPPGPLSEEPPHQDSIPMTPNGGALPLRANVPANAAFLEFQSWLLRTYRDAKSLPSDRQDEEFRRLRMEVISGVKLELEKLEQMKAKEWVKQRDLQNAARQRAAAGMPIFDTSEQPNILLRYVLLMAGSTTPFSARHHTISTLPCLSSTRCCAECDLQPFRPSMRRLSASDVEGNYQRAAATTWRS